MRGKSDIVKRVNRQMGKAIHDYGMIQDKDRILVAVSGGKDSLTLLALLFELAKRAPVDFTLLPVFVDPGFEEGPAESLSSFVRRRFGMNLSVERTDHGPLSHSGQNRENPCFLCSRLRRKRIFEVASAAHCTKIAMGHHKDDMIETLFINMCYAGRIGTMKPCQVFFDGAMTMIRPLAYVEKEDIVMLAKKWGFPEFVNPCPSEGNTKRSLVRGFLNDLYKENRNVKGNLFRSMENVQMDYLLKQTL